MSDEEYQERLHHQRIHHEAHFDAEHDDVITCYNNHVTEYQLDRMYDHSNATQIQTNA